MVFLSVAHLIAIVHYSIVQYALYYTAHTLLNLLYKGHIENLPEMTQGRWYHGCGSYYSGGTMVSVVVIVMGGTAN